MSRGRGLMAAGALGLTVIAGGAAAASWPGETEITYNKKGNIETTLTPGFVQDDIAVRDLNKDLNGDGVTGDVIRQDNEVADFALLVGGAVVSDLLLVAGATLASRADS